MEQDRKKQGMGMPAGGTAVGREILHPMRDRLPLSAVRSGICHNGRTPPWQPLAPQNGQAELLSDGIRLDPSPATVYQKRYLIQLAKNCKQSYHKVWWLARLGRAALERGRRSLWSVRLLPFLLHCYLLEKNKRKKRAVFGIARLGVFFLGHACLDYPAAVRRVVSFSHGRTSFLCVVSSH